MSLLTQQRDLRAWLQHGDEVAAAPFAASVQPGLAVYQNNYRAQLAGCLAESFPVTLAWLGEDAFHRAVVAHVERVPPSSWSLDHYPRDFPSSLAALYPDDPEVADLASLELALSEAFVAPGGSPLKSVADDIDWDNAAFEFLPSLSLHPLTSNAPAIWSAISAGQSPPASERLPRTGALLVWQSDELCRFRAIDASECKAIRVMIAGATLGSLCDGLDDNEAEQIGLWLGQWLADGLVTEILDTVAGPRTRHHEPC